MGGGSEARAMGGVVEGPPTALPSLNPEADQSFNLLGGAFADLDGQVGGPVLSCIATDAQLLVWRVPPLRCCGRLTAQRLSFPGTWGPCTAAHALVPAAGRRRNRLACRWSPVPRPSLPSLAAAALPQIPGSGGDLRKQQILKQQRWLLFLRHCARCQLGEAQCQYGRNCTVAKQLWQHLVHCKEARCDYPRCNPSRELLRHHQKCTSPNCPVCAPVKQYVSKQRQQVFYRKTGEERGGRRPPASCRDVVCRPDRGHAGGRVGACGATACHQGGGLVADAAGTCGWGVLLQAVLA
jgi:hypothetical protein